MINKLYEQHRDAIEDERVRTEKHAAYCFAPYKCQSCGCDRRGVIYREGPTVCPSHMDSDAYKNSLLERIARAQEALLKKQR